MNNLNKKSVVRSVINEKSLIWKIFCTSEMCIICGILTYGYCIFYTDNKIYH